MNLQESRSSRGQLPIAYAPVKVICESIEGGGYKLRSTQKLETFDPSLAKLFRRAVESHAGRVFIAERSDDGSWRTLTYEQTRPIVDSIAQSLIKRGLSAERPVLILSGNSIEHAILSLACYTAGVPVAPLSVAYSLQSEDHSKVKNVTALLRPGLVYVSDTGPFAKALSHLCAEIVAKRNGANIPNVTSFDDLWRNSAGPEVEKAVANIGHGTIAKFLFTSGSTGFPKTVINTHGMLTANQQALAQIWPFIAEDELVLVDWLPWSHTFGGNHNFHLVLRHAGTLYVDAGKPVPGLVEHTVRNIGEVSPTIYFNVPAGFAALLPYLESDTSIAKAFFARLRLIFYAAAALPQDLWSRLEDVSSRTIGHRVPMTSSWGATETAPAVTAAHFPLERAGVIGVPIPGIELKLLPSNERLEVRVKGPHVTPGYWGSPELTADAFDEEGYYKIGDAVRFADPQDPAKGLVYDGRIAENFKLSSGSWVRVGALRIGVLAAASPVLQDAVIAGEGHNFVAIMAWLNRAGCAQLLGQSSTATPRELAEHPAIHAHIRKALTSWNAENSGATMRVRRVLLLTDAPSIDSGEITDKGYVNQRAVLDNRGEALRNLLDDAHHPNLVVVES